MDTTSFRAQGRQLDFSLKLAGLFLLLCLVNPLSALAGEKNGMENQRPRIGLVLAGGGAKGGAHVGVLKVLEELRIPIDYIAGTSMGSIVGGLYASGLSPDEIEKEIKNIDWDDVFVDSPEREDRSFRRKQDDQLYLFKAKPGFNNGKLQVPYAYIRGQKFDLQLNRLTQRVANIKNFDKLPIPYRAVAADLETGREVILDSGNLSLSIRASMAVPGAFDPVLIDDKVLVDGGIANNIPVSVARSMGADILIVSELGSDLLTRDEIESGLDVAGQMVNFLFGLNSRKSLESLDSNDVRISVQLGDIGSGSFDRILETIPLGEEAARKAKSSLQRYALSKSEYKQHLAARWDPDTASKTVSFINIENDSDVSDDVIKGYLSIQPGSALNIPQLEHDIEQIYGLEIFQYVRYQIVEQDGETGLEINVKAKPWGPAYIQTGMLTSMDFEGDSSFRLGVAYTKTQINSLNGEWRLGGQIGDEPAFFTELYQPLDSQGRYFTSALIGYVTQNRNTYNSDGDRLKELHADGFGVELSIGRQFGTWGEASLNYRRQTGEVEVRTGTPEPDRDYDRGEFSLSLYDDKIDSLYFPTKGHVGILEYKVSRQEFGADTDFEQLEAGYQQALNWGDNTLIAGINIATTLDDNAPFHSLNSLGGFLQLSVYQTDELTGQHSGLLRAIYLRRLSNAKFFQTYFGTSLEAGNVWQDSDDIDIDDTIVAGSLFIGADSPLGPIYLSYGVNDDDNQSLTLYLGPLFSF